MNFKKQKKQTLLASIDECLAWSSYEPIIWRCKKCGCIKFYIIHPQNTSEHKTAFVCANDNCNQWQTFKEMFDKKLFDTLTKEIGLFLNKNEI